MTTHFSTRLVTWQAQHGRHDLPWQGGDPYRVWLSEIMLQQTQVSTVIPYFQRFVAQFPDVVSLAAAPLDTVLGHWAGLGYYARARNLHRCAQIIVRDHAGQFPRSALALAELPGIGRSTGAAIAAFCFGERAAILDGNVRRVLCRHAGIAGFPGERAVLDKLWTLAEARLPIATDIGPYTQGLMDLGATVCTRSRPQCEVCPVAADCVARLDQRQSQLPTPRPRKAIPLRTVRFLLLQHGDKWLLQRRPPEGLWGGLLAPYAPGEDHLNSLTAVNSQLTNELAALGLQAIGEAHGPFQLKHTFTHFQLDIEAWHVVVQGTAPTLEALPFNALGRAALPTPVKKLLQAATCG